MAGRESSFCLSGGSPGFGCRKAFQLLVVRRESSHWFPGGSTIKSFQEKVNFFFQQGVRSLVAKSWVKSLVARRESSHLWPRGSLVIGCQGGVLWLVTMRESRQ